MTIVLTDLRHRQHEHRPDEEYAHFDCNFKANGKPATVTVAVQARLLANAWFSLDGFLKAACCERVKTWYDVPMLVEWG